MEITESEANDADISADNNQSDIQGTSQNFKNPDQISVMVLNLYNLYNLED